MLVEDIEILRDNLVHYGDLSDIEDTYPALIELDNDTVAVLSENNLIDANIITAKYEGELCKNRLLNDIVYNDSITISLRDEIIYNKDVIILNQEQSYNAMKENLEIASSLIPRCARYSRAFVLDSRFFLKYFAASSITS